MVGIALGALPILSSCEAGRDSDDAEADDAEADAAAAANRFAELLGHSFCTLAFQCCSPDERFNVGSTERECRLNFETDLEAASGPAYRKLLDEGRVRFREERFAECLDDAVAKGCAYAQELIDCVWEGFAGLVGAGGSCEAPIECADGACVGAGNGLAGSCGAPLASGAECTSHLECASAACIDGDCTQRVPDGGACFDGAECVSRDCTFDFVCSDQRVAFCRPLSKPSGDPT